MVSQSSDIFLAAPEWILAPPATPPFRLRARRTPDLAARKRPRPTPHPTRLRLRALTAFGGRRFPGPSAGRALRLTRGAACSAQQPRESSRKAHKTALKPGFPHRGKSFSIVWKNPEKFFHCVEKLASFFHSVETFFPLCGKIAKKFSIVWKTSGSGAFRAVFQSAFGWRLRHNPARFRPVVRYNPTASRGFHART